MSYTTANVVNSTTTALKYLTTITLFFTVANTTTSVATIDLFLPLQRNVTHGVNNKKLIPSPYCKKNIF